MTLAYVFWHSRRADAERGAYEGWLTSFHSALLHHPVEGYLGSRVLRTGSLPWLASPLDVYEDWYFLESSAALDRLNDAAVTGARRSSHDATAGLAAVGTAGLYRLRRGARPDLPPHTACWLSKPDGESYGAFHRRIEQAGFNGCLWQRQMVLGPTPEFCLQLRGDERLDGIDVALRTDVEEIWARWA